MPITLKIISEFSWSMKRTISVLIFLLLFSSSYLYADPWGSKELNDALQYLFATWITDAYSVFLILLLLFSRSKLTKTIFLILSLSWYLVFVCYSICFYQSNTDLLHQRESEFRHGVYMWRNYYAVIAVGIVVTILYSIYYLFIKVIRKKS
jgi:hypothetical protein